MTKKMTKLCACGCGLPLPSIRQAWNGIVLYNHVEAYARKINAGALEPPYWITCGHAECQRTGPAIYPRQKYCHEELTGRNCRVEATAAVKQASNRRAAVAKSARQQAEYEAGAVAPKAAKLNRPSNAQPCHCCRFYGSGQGCPPDVLPCSDRTEVGLPWRHEENGGAPCWEQRTVYPTGGGSAVGRLNLSRGPGGSLPD